jgi:hypothetical protein
VRDIFVSFAQMRDPERESETHRDEVTGDVLGWIQGQAWADSPTATLNPSIRIGATSDAATSLTIFGRDTRVSDVSDAM